MPSSRLFALVLCALALSCTRSPAQWGYIARSGRIAIAPAFGGAGEFSEGLAPVRIGGQWGYIDLSGKVVIPPRFGRAESFAEGLALVSTAEERELGNPGTRYGFIDHMGRFVIPEQFGWALSFSEGLAAACSGECALRWNSEVMIGFVGKTGAFAIKPQFFGASQFAEGVAAVSLDPQRRNWGYIDKSGDFVLEPSFSLNSSFSEGLAVQTDGFIDKAGRTIIRAPRPAEAHAFSDGMALTSYAWLNISPESKSNRAEFLDHSGATVLTTRPCASAFSEGLASLCDERFLYGFIDRTGHYVIRPQWPKVGRFKSGLAPICSNCRGSD